MTTKKVLIIPRIPMRCGGKQFQFGLARLQFPLKAAFALTINRSQGQSAAKCGIYSQKVFGPMDRYMYVSFSRCGNPNHVCRVTTEELRGVGAEVRPVALNRGEQRGGTRRTGQGVGREKSNMGNVGQERTRDGQTKRDRA